MTANSFDAGSGGGSGDTAGSASRAHIRPTMRGVQYVLPYRMNAGRACGGCFVTMFGLFFITPPTFIVVMLAKDAKPQPDAWIFYLFALPFFLIGLSAIALGLVFFFGNVWIWIEDETLIVRKGLAFLRITRRFPLSSIRAVSLLPAALRPGTGLADFKYTNSSGKQVAIAQQVAADELRTLAEDLARRCRLPLDDRTRAFAGTAALSATAASSAGFPAAPQGISRQTNVVLSPPSGTGGWLVLLIVAVLWNGLSWTSATVIWFNVKDGRWCALGFVSIFCAVGLLLIVGAISKLMAAARMHPPVVSVSFQPLYLGEPFTCRIEQQAKRQVTIDGVEVKLTCKESATYRRGTNTTTVHHEVWSNTTTAAEGEMIDQVKPLSAEVSFQIPADAMHSFDAPRNKIQWLLDVRTKIPRWPDYTAQVILQVAPRRYGTSAEAETQDSPEGEA